MRKKLNFSMKLFSSAIFAVLLVAGSPVAAMDKMKHKHEMKPAPHMEHGKPDHGHGKPMEAHTGGMPHDLDTGRQRLTDTGLFSVDIASRLDPVAINKMHSWVLRVRDKDGNPVENAKVLVGGGMPQHGHGLPTKPRVTKNLGDGKYLVEGVRFSMNGWWEVKFDIDSGGRKDSVTFNLVLK